MEKGGGSCHERCLPELSHDIIRSASDRLATKLEGVRVGTACFLSVGILDGLDTHDAGETTCREDRIVQPVWKQTLIPCNPFEVLVGLWDKVPRWDAVNHGEWDPGGKTSTPPVERLEPR